MLKSIVYAELYGNASQSESQNSIIAPEPENTKPEKSENGKNQIITESQAEKIMTERQAENWENWKKRECKN